MVIKYGNVLLDTFMFDNKDIRISDTTIDEIGNNFSQGTVIDASDCYVVPRFIDTHMHSAVGKIFIDFDDDTYDKITSLEAKRGTTSLVDGVQNLYQSAYLLGALAKWHLNTPHRQSAYPTRSTV